MPQLIKNRAVVDDRWTLLREAAELSDLAADTPQIVPLAFWLAHRDALKARGDIGVWLAPVDDPATLAADVGALPVIAVDFPSFTDGRGYSIGRMLRDQLFALAECGFDAFLIRADKDAAAALAGLDDFDRIYASTSRRPQPWFRQRGQASGGGPSGTTS